MSMIEMCILHRHEKSVAELLAKVPFRPAGLIRIKETVPTQTTVRGLLLKNLGPKDDQGSSGCLQVRRLLSHCDWFLVKL